MTAPCIPDNIKENEELSRAAVVMVVRHGLSRAQSYARMGQYNNASYLAFLADANVAVLFPNVVDSDAFPPPAAYIAGLIIGQALKMLYFFALGSRIPARQAAIQVYAYSYVSMAKLGNMSAEFADKIVSGVQDELGINIHMNEETVRNIYNHFLKGMNELNAGEVITVISGHIPDAALRLRLTLEQSSFVGLGCFIAVGQAMSRYWILDGEHPIVFLSRILTDAEKNYTVIELECLAMVWAIKKLRAYVEGSHFKVITDHSALRWLKTLKDPNGRLAHWALEMQQWDFDVLHRKGALHHVPDALSRMYEDEEVVKVASFSEEVVKRDSWYVNMLKNVAKNPKKYKNWKIEVCDYIVGCPLFNDVFIYYGTPPGSLKIIKKNKVPDEIGL